MGQEFCSSHQIGCAIFKSFEDGSILSLNLKEDARMERGLACIPKAGIDFDILPGRKAGRNCRDRMSYSIGGANLKWDRFFCQSPSISCLQADMDFIGVRLEICGVQRPTA